MFVCGYRTHMGWEQSWVIDEWVAAVSSWCHRGVSCCCRVAPFVWLPHHPVSNVAPVSRCEKGIEEGSGYLPEQTRQCRCGTSATLSLLSTWLPSFVTLVVSSVCAVRAVCSQRSIILVAVVAVGESGESAGSVGVNGGGGGGVLNGTIVVCLLVVDDNKSNIGVC